MKKTIFIILNLSLIFNVVSMQEDVPSVRVIELQFNDGKKSQEAVDILVQSNTLKNLLEGASGAEIYLQNVSSVEGTILIDLLKDLKDNPEEIEQKIIDKVKNLSAQQLVELINAVNFLDIPSLLNPLLKYISSQMDNYDVLKNTILHLPYEILELVLPSKLEVKTLKATSIDLMYDPTYAVSFDGSTIVLKGEDGGIYIYDRAGNLIGFNQEIKFAKHSDIEMSSDGSTIAITGSDLHLHLHLYVIDKIGNLLWSDTQREYFQIAISSDGSTVLGLAGDYHIYIFDKTGKLIGSDTQREYSTFQVSADGSTVAAQENNTKHIYIFDKTGKLIGSDTQRKYNIVQVSADGSFIVALNRSDYFYIYILNRFGHIMNSHKERYYSDVQISLDGIIALLSKHGHLYVYKDGQPIGSQQQAKYSEIKMSQDGSTIVAQAEDGYIYIFRKDGMVRLQQEYEMVDMNSDGSVIVFIMKNDKHIYVYNKYGQLIGVDTEKKYDSFKLGEESIVAKTKDNDVYILRPYLMSINSQNLEIIIKKLLDNGSFDELVDLKIRMEKLKKNFLVILNQEKYDSYIKELTDKVQNYSLLKRLNIDWVKAALEN